MEEKKLIEPIPEEEFKEKAKELAEKRHLERVEAFVKAGYLSLRIYDGVNKYKSVRRAIRRGLVSLYGDVYPKRPFNNSKYNKTSINTIRKNVYEQLRRAKLNAESDTND